MFRIQENERAKISRDIHDSVVQDIRGIRLETENLNVMDDSKERQKKIEGRCGRCVHFALCGGGFRTRAAFANGHWYGSDPGCYLTEEEISTPLPEIK